MAETSDRILRGAARNRRAWPWARLPCRATRGGAGAGLPTAWPG